MNGKTLTTFALGAATGFVAGGIFVVTKVVTSKGVRKIAAKAVAEALVDWVYKDENRPNASRWRRNENGKITYNKIYGDERVGEN